MPAWTNGYGVQVAGARKWGTETRRNATEGLPTAAELREFEAHQRRQASQAGGGCVGFIEAVLWGAA